jgi:hypothetical protein
MGKHTPTLAVFMSGPDSAIGSLPRINSKRYPDESVADLYYPGLKKKL